MVIRSRCEPRSAFQLVYVLALDADWRDCDVGSVNNALVVMMFQIYIIISEMKIRGTAVFSNFNRIAVLLQLGALLRYL